MKILLLAEQCICCGSRDLAASPAVLMPFVAKRVLGHDPVEVTENWGLRDLRRGTAYTLCNSLQCRECGTLFLDYRFTDEQMAALYSGYRDAAYTLQRDRYEAGYANTMAVDYAHRHAYIAGVEDWLAPRLPACPRVLDWGGGDGTNTPFLGKGTIHVHDISGVPVVAGAEQVELGLLDQCDYDVVTCCQVLEHAPSPLDLVGEIALRLSQRTLLYIEVPHEQLMREHPGTRDLAKLKRHWHEHVNFFTETGLRRLLDRAGLQLVDVHYLPINNGVRMGEVIGLLARRAT
jgi:hypothetical protein